MDRIEKFVQRSRESMDGSRESIKGSRESMDGSRESMKGSRESMEGSRESVRRRLELIDETRETSDGRRESTAGRRESVGGRRESVGGRRESVGGRRESVGGRRESVGGRRESVGGRRESVGGRRESMSRPRRESIQFAQAEVARLRARTWHGHRRKSQALPRVRTPSPVKETQTMIEKFIMAARVVRRLCQVALCMRKYAEDTLGKVFEGLSKPRRQSCLKEQGNVLSFDAGFFKTDFEHLFPDSAKRVAGKLPSERTPADLKLIGAVLRSLSSFRKYPRNIQDMLSRVVRYQSLGVNRVVIKKGHPGTAFYMVFSGRVGVVTTDDPDELMQRASMVVLRKGAIFGEMAMITGDKRNATIQTLEQTELVVVDSYNLQDSDMHVLLKRDFKYKFDFLRKLSLFSSWGDAPMERLASLSKTETMPHGNVVVTDMGREPMIVFVTKGSCDVIKLVDISQASIEMGDGESNISARVSSSHLLESLPTAKGSVTSPATLTKTPSSLHALPPIRQAASSDKSSGEIAAGEEEEAVQQARRKSVVVGVRFKEHRKSSGPKQLLSFSDIPMPADVGRVESGDHIDERSRARAKRKYSRRISHCPQRVGTFMTLGKLGPGKAFGLAHVSKSPIPPHLSLVSRGASILHVTLRDFRAVSEGQPALHGLDTERVEVPPDKILCEKFFQESQWESYKRRVVEQTMVDIHRPKDGLGLRNYDAIDTYPMSEDILVLDVGSSALLFLQSFTGGIVLPRPQQTPASRAAQKRLGSEYIDSPIFARDNKGSLRMIDMIEDRTRNPSRNQHGLKCHHLPQDSR
ncbi:cyclic nucleotide-binding domain-containing protein 2-like [Branchiostoma lanceolatum]|uniref:cyclic nucleotide-binding domain-containing protein 2-like n=1 Tax=Branchiostoma lanceolatum TaxID=7740 RepID=UPI003455AA47